MAPTTTMATSGFVLPAPLSCATFTHSNVCSGCKRHRLCCSSRPCSSSVKMQSTGPSSSSSSSCTGGTGAVSRRVFFKVTCATLASATAVNLNVDESFRLKGGFGASAAEGPFTLPALPYAYDALEPRISEAIMVAHHDTHFKTYVANLNAAISDMGSMKITDDASLISVLADMDVMIPNESMRARIRNNGGGYLNHKLFFAQLAAKPRPLDASSQLGKAIQRRFGSVDELKAIFLAEAGALFGSGFTWLVRDTNGEVSIVKTANQDNPIMGGKVKGLSPVLACDCWEHAWYLEYGPKKKDYFPQWWASIDWPVVDQVYKTAAGSF